MDWSRNTVGPYRILKRLRNVTTAEEVGRVYAALHQPTGQQVLLVAPRKRWRPKAAWSVLLRAHLQPTPLFSLHVRRSPDAPAEPTPELERGLELLSTTLKGVQYNQEAADHLTPAATPARAWWHGGRGYWVGLGAALLASLFCLPRAPRHHDQQAPAQPAQVSAAEEALAAPEHLPVASLNYRATWHGVALEIPGQPFKGQNRAPCEQGVEVEIPTRDGTRACWIGVRYSAAACKTRGYEWKGECYLPSIPAPREPSSLRVNPGPLPAAPAE